MKKYRKYRDHNRERLLGKISNAIHRCGKGKYKKIKIYVNWIDNRESFLEYLMTLDGWDNPNLELDRKDNTKDYEPGNLRFVTRIIQANNKSTTVYVTYLNETLPFAEFCRKWIPHNIFISTVRGHLNRGKSPADIVRYFTMKNARK